MGITASDLMTTHVVTLAPEMNLMEMDTILVTRGVSGAPVVDGQRLVGVASQTDIIRSVWQQHHEAFSHGSYYSTPSLVPISALDYISRDSPQVGNQLVELKVRDVMTIDPLVAHPDDPIEGIAERMVEDQIHRLPITDPGDGELLGIISTLDLARAIHIHGLSGGG